MPLVDSRLGKGTTCALATVLVWVLCGQALSADARPACAVVDIDQIGWQGLQAARDTHGVDWWIELGDELLVCGNKEALSSIDRRFDTTPLPVDLDLDRLRVAGGFHASELEQLGVEVIARSSGLAILHVGEAWQPGDDEQIMLERPNRILAPAERKSVLVRQAANGPPRPRQLFESTVQDLVDMVDGDRWFADVVVLASYNRYTYNPGILDARDWLVSQFDSLSGLQVTTSSFNMAGGTIAYNVLATLEGQERPDDWYIIGGHYDATSEFPHHRAPGAEDNASGCAGVLEMARIFAAHPPEATVLFICYSGEEQGLFGSEDHVDDLIAAGDLSKVLSVLNLDMIGYTSDGDLDCLLETDPFAEPLLEIFEDAAAEFTTLRILTSLNSCCSDHVPYLDAKVPALLTIENDWFEYPYYHNSNDLPEYLTIEMAEEILKMNVAAMAQIMGAPAEHVFQDSFETGDTTSWSETVP
ncbi:MAG: M28 family peptidase [Nitrospirae bacterium]|nr:M28 family peptidase [Nitrospirota bacterium]